MKPLDQLLDHFALEGIIEVNDQRSAGPAEIEDILVDHANRNAGTMFLLPFLNILRSRMRQMLAQFHADDFAKGQFGSEQQGTAFSGTDIDEAESLDAAARGERIDPAAAHLAKNRRRDSGISGEVSVVGMASDEVALAEISSRVEAVTLIERMFDKTKGQRGAHGSGRSHFNRPSKSVSRLADCSAI